MQQHCGGQQAGQHCHAVPRSQHRCHECPSRHPHESRGVLLCPRLPADCGSSGSRVRGGVLRTGGGPGHSDTPTLRHSDTPTLRPIRGSALTGVGGVVEVLNFSINTFIENNTHKLCLSHLDLLGTFSIQRLNKLSPHQFGTFVQMLSPSATIFDARTSVNFNI